MDDTYLNNFNYKDIINWYNTLIIGNLLEMEKTFSNKVKRDNKNLYDKLKFFSLNKDMLIWDKIKEDLFRKKEEFFEIIGIEDITIIERKDILLNNNNIDRIKLNIDVSVKNIFDIIELVF